MKFTKEALLEAIKGKLGANGKTISMSDKTLKGQTEALYDLGVTEETELDDFVKKILPTLENLEGQYRHDNAAFVEQWKKDHPDTKNVPPKTDPKPTGNEDLDEMKKMIAEMKAEREAEKKAKAVADKKTALLAKFKEEGVDDDKWATTYLGGLAVDENTDVDACAKTAKELFNGSKSRGSNYTPRSAGGSGAEGEDAEIADALKSLKSHMGINGSAQK